MEIVPTFVTAQGAPLDEDVIARKIDEERERRKKRADRFGVELKEPNKEKVIRQSEDLGDVVKVKRYYPKGEIEYGKFKNIDEDEKERESRKDLRTQRYGQREAEEEKRAAAEAEAYDEMEIEEAEKGSLIAAAKGDLRPEALHLHGTDDMSTADIFRYFGEHHVPSFIEWINDSSCNAVFETKEKSRGALMALTEALKDVAGTPFENFRKGRDWKLNQPILMRFATTEDKKDNKKRKSKYYETYGLPNQSDDRGGKRRRIDKERTNLIRDPSRQVAIAPIETQMRMDVEEGAEIKILIENDLFAPGGEEPVIGRHAPPSTPVGPPPSSPVFANISRRDAEILRDEDLDQENDEDQERVQGNGDNEEVDEKGEDDGYEEEEEGNEPVD